jgi:hypothetical protein
VKAHLEKLGGVGADIAAAACPVCFPKLALIGALDLLKYFRRRSYPARGEA